MSTKKSGFRLPSKEGVLDLAGTDYEGSEVRVHLSVPLRTYFELDSLVKQAGEADEGMDQAVVRQMCSFFVDHCLMEWNLEEDDGTQTPLTVEGLLSAPLDFVTSLIKLWLEMAVALLTPLEEPGTNGTALTEEELELGNMSRPG